MPMGQVQLGTGRQCEQARLYWEGEGRVREEPGGGTLEFRRNVSRLKTPCRHGSKGHHIIAGIWCTKNFPRSQPKKTTDMPHMCLNGVHHLCQQNQGSNTRVTGEVSMLVATSRIIRQGYCATGRFWFHGSFTRPHRQLDYGMWPQIGWPWWSG